MSINDLNHLSKKIRYYVLSEAVKKNRGHLGGTFSCIELLVCLYYSNIFSFNNKDVKNGKNDHFILSKGHACSALYWILHNKGFISRKVLDSYALDYGLGAQLDIKIKGVDWNTGSLGHAIGISSGIVIGDKLSKKNRKAISLIGDAECAEGSVWESLIFAGDNNISNLIVIVDRNRLSVTEELSDDSFFGSLPKILQSIGWEVMEIDGHNFKEILNAYKMSHKSNKPFIIIANTIKGKGVSFMENKKNWHHSIPTTKQINIALNDLKK